MANAVDTESAELLRGLFLLIETKGLVTKTQKAQITELIWRSELCDF